MQTDQSNVYELACSIWNKKWLAKLKKENPKGVILPQEIDFNYENSQREMFFRELLIADPWDKNNPINETLKFSRFYFNGLLKEYF
ncbi:MAG: hypothetical protein RLZZ540_2013 [Bacteroidota bacterium]|jgi:hypothetical protein